MKLAEALAERHDAQVRMGQLTGRISESALVQEGDEASEDVTELVHQAEATARRVVELAAQINRTNSATELADGTTLTRALAERDGALALQRFYSQVATAGSRSNGARYLRTELRMVSLVDVAELRRRADGAAKRYRELDTLIQQANWNTDLLED